MLEIFKTVNNEIVLSDTFEDGVWVNLVDPTEDEINSVNNALNVEADFLRAALDEEERARIESDNGQTLIIVDIPIIAKEGKMNLYTTIPLAIILIKHIIITVCLKEDTLLNDFRSNKVKDFFTQYKTRFVLQILYKNATRYLQYLKHIDKTSNRIEQDLHKSMRNKELIQMLKLEKSLVYFSTALKSNEVVLEKLMKFEHIKSYPEDTELLEDVIIENRQAIEMANIYSSILSGTMDAFASVISNNLNIVMKFLTSVTIVMAIPTMISSFFGMNVDIPLAGPFAFWIIVVMALAMCLITGFTLYKKKMF
ncbi:MAG: magnesium transporter CorA family protein [Clostridiales bacterium]|jgi:magnesium transporter|nr:magnesium transporter CorA family protein [Eubacteriales bacterium]MDH7564968.1 magnesium transporter CorA family protein [Clostridiales bacterium]